MKFNELYRQIMLDEKKEILKDLKDVDVTRISRDMEKIETQNFKIGWGSDYEDIEDDFESYDGFMGVGVFEEEDDSIQGYIYGYSISSEEYEHLDDNMADDVKIYNKNYQNAFSSVRAFKATFNPKDSFYVSNLVADGKYRAFVGKMMKKLFIDLKNAGLKYITFNALTDTQNLLFDENGNPRVPILKRMGLSLIATIGEGDGMLGILELV